MGTIAEKQAGRQHEHVTEQRMERFVRGQLQAPEAQRIDEHIHWCAACCALWGDVTDRVLAPAARTARAL